MSIEISEMFDVIEGADEMHDAEHIPYFQKPDEQRPIGSYNMEEEFMEDMGIMEQFDSDFNDIFN